MKIQDYLNCHQYNLTLPFDFFTARFSMKLALVFCIGEMIKLITTLAIPNGGFLPRRVITIVSLFSLLFFVAANNAHAQASEPVLQGYVDSIVVKGDRVTARGWVGVTDSSHVVASLSIWVANTQVYEGGFERAERSDVAKATGRNDWLKSGWLIDAPLSSDLESGVYPVKVLAKLDNGQTAVLVLPKAIQPIHFDSSPHQSKRMIWMLRISLTVLLALVCAVYFKADYLAVKFSSKIHYLVKPSVFFGGVLLVSFVALLSLGITGSSFNLGLKNHDFFVQASMPKVFGTDKAIRGDEWRVFTPFAIAQYNHQPKFPILNKNIGEDGQNMLVIGMAGAPVAHISAIAKPATWGFFLFDLKRALSWYWCFPIFACLFALWGSISLLLPDNWRASFLIALSFSVSPFVTAWSNWPAYIVCFACLALLSTIAILRSHNNYLVLTLGGLLGVVLAGFVLVLYPPWQVSLMYVFLPLTVGLIIRDKLYRNFNQIRLASFGIAIIISSLILWKWWSDAHVAIEAMMATVYPGRRSTVVGGNLLLTYLLRGYTNIVTLYTENMTDSNESEIASFSYMLLPLVLAFVVRAFHRAISAVEIALAISIGVILYFMLVGVPIEVAKLSLWGRVPPNRADLALGLANIMLCGILLLPGAKPISAKMPLKIAALAIALFWAAIVINSIYLLQNNFRFDFSPGVKVVIFFMVVIAGYWLVIGKFREFMYLNLMWSIAMTWPFNPIRIAPGYVNASAIVNDLATASNINPNRSILALEESTIGVFLAATGLPAINGVLYYPQTSLWERLDKDHTEWNVYNRYQHLFFTGGLVDNVDHYRIETINMDVVRVVVDLERFDFLKTGARFIVAPQREENILKKNAVLAFIRNERGWSWFEIKGVSNAN